MKRRSLHVHEWGSRDDVPLLFWHALGPDQSGAQLGRVAPSIACAGFHVLAVDGPGFGRSPALPAERYRLDSLVELLYELADERNLERPVLMGHSWGGAIAVSYAGAYPADVRALVVLESGHIDDGDLPDAAVERPVDEWIAEIRARPDPRRAEARGMAMHGLATDGRGALVRGAWPVIAEHEIPTLLFLAEDPSHVEQNRAGAARFESAVSHAEMRWPEEAGHGLLGDVGPPLGDEIASWLVDQGL